MARCASSIFRPRSATFQPRLLVSTQAHRASRLSRSRTTMTYAAVAPLEDGEHGRSNGRRPQSRTAARREAPELQRALLPSVAVSLIARTPDKASSFNFFGYYGFVLVDKKHRKPRIAGALA